ncbi:MAG: hypothetical protein RL757_1275 [Bacteroidota bacterium]|jgi:hypothetical protein
MIEKVQKVCVNAKKAELLPDTRLVVTLYHENDKQILTMDINLLNVNGQSYIINDEIRAYFGKLTNNKW